MSAKEIEVLISLGRGDAAVQILTCDMGYDYVKINAEYHT
jgi:glutamate N-acetyltransferase/amino-acid N-acetyltransferase